MAYSRLWGNSLVEQLTDIGCRTVEVPHVLGIPVALTLDADATRIVEWPNFLGVNEVHDTTDIVRWDPLLAQEPSSGVIVRIHTNAEQADIRAPTRTLRWVVRRLEQIVGVTGAAPVVAPTTVVLTPGLRSGELRAVTSEFPGATHLVRPELGEFPGGLVLVATSEMCATSQRYAEILGDTILARSAT